MLFEWFSRFRVGRECVKDEAHTNWSNSVCTPKTIEKNCEHVNPDHRLTIRVVANELNISKEVITQILAQNLFEQDLGILKLSRKQWRDIHIQEHLKKITL